jgi:hypothetical protein
MAWLIIIIMTLTVIRINQLPVYASRCQQGSQIFFADFIVQKITKLLKTQHPLKPENMNINLEPLEF